MGLSSRNCSSTGGVDWPALRSVWTCRPTGRVRASKAIAARCASSRSAASSPSHCASSRVATDVSMFTVLLAVFKTLLHRYSGAEDLVVGAPASGRHHEETAHLLGFFSNTLAMRTDLSGDPPFAELLQRVKVTTLEARIHQELPFEKLVEVLNPRARAESLPAVPSAVRLRRRPGSAAHARGKSARSAPDPGLAVVAVRPFDRRRASWLTAPCTRSSSTRRTCSTPPRSSA